MKLRLVVSIHNRVIFCFPSCPLFSRYCLFCRMDRDDYVKVYIGLMWNRKDTIKRPCFSMLEECIYIYRYKGGIN